MDDLWFGWIGTEREFTLFKSELNKVGKVEGITFKGSVGKSVDFLDTTVSLKGNGQITTSLYTKPTDASRYLHRRSDHGQHTFKSIAYSQFRRAIVLCSDENDRLRCIDYMSEKLRNSGYKEDEIANAKEKALALDRDEILNGNNTPVVRNPTQRVLTFTINRDSFMSMQIRKIVYEIQTDIDLILGEPTRIVVAERRNPNTAALLFAKSSFSRCIKEESDNQECGGRDNGCKTCDLMDLPKFVDLWKENPARKRTLKLDFRCDCTTENVLYLYLCKICTNNDSFYVGQTVNPCRKRASGHRSSFNERDFKKSALSHHIYNDHREHVDKKLNNFSLGVIKQTLPVNLDRLEDFYVNDTNAELSLNRYKVIA